MDPVANEIFKVIKDGKPIGDIGTQFEQTPTSEANIAVPVVDHDSGTNTADVERVLSAAGFDRRPTR
jgi:hypothetical protein